MHYRAQWRLERRGGKCSVFLVVLLLMTANKNTSNCFNRLIGEYFSYPYLLICCWEQIILPSFLFNIVAMQQHPPFRAIIQGFKPCFISQLSLSLLFNAIFYFYIRTPACFCSSSCILPLSTFACVISAIFIRIPACFASFFTHIKISRCTP